MYQRDPYGAEITDVRVSALAVAALIVAGAYLALLILAPDLSGTWTNPVCCAGTAFAWAALALFLNKVLARPPRPAPRHPITAPPFSGVPVPPPVVCAACGGPLRPEASFCGRCGAAVPKG